MASFLPCPLALIAKMNALKIEMRHFLERKQFQNFRNEYQNLDSSNKILALKIAASFGYDKIFEDGQVPELDPGQVRELLMSLVSEDQKTLKRVEIFEVR